MRKLTALIMLGLMISSSASGQVPTVPNATKAPTSEADKQTTANVVPSGSRDLTAADAEAFLDGIVPLQLAQQDTPATPFSFKAIRI